MFGAARDEPAFAGDYKVYVEFVAPGGTGSESGSESESEEESEEESE